MEAKKDFGAILATLLEKKLPDAERPILATRDKSHFKEDERFFEEQKKKKQILTAKRERKVLQEKERKRAEFTPLEKKLIRIATRGVVTLFNAVSKQQHSATKKEKDDEVIKQVKKKQKVQLPVLSDKVKTPASMLAIAGKIGLGLVPSQSVDSSIENKALSSFSSSSPAVSTSSSFTSAITPQAKNWSILSDDYLMGAQLKDWDQSLGDEGSDDEK